MISNWRFLYERSPIDFRRKGLNFFWAIVVSNTTTLTSSVSSTVSGGFSINCHDPVGNIKFIFIDTAFKIELTFKGSFDGLGTTFLDVIVRFD
jgi:hypothetical protein